MNSLEDSIVHSLDGNDNKDIFPYLPYILQDLWEMGASVNNIHTLIERYQKYFTGKLKILDLGCGKGVVSIKSAKKFGANCTGVDGMNEFIIEAKEKAKEHKVSELCSFELGDIRNSIVNYKNFDFVILGAVGPIFGSYSSTLSAVSKSLQPNGLLILDDGYLNDESSIPNPNVLKRHMLMEQATSTGLVLLDEIISGTDEIKGIDEDMYKKIKDRCNELMTKYPEKEKLFKGYLMRQEEENHVLENEIIGSTMIFGNKDHWLNFKIS
jgi:ubiquinone/menaquinone biosynthesis C-methylase UbiE